MKHKHYNMILAKAANMELIVFIKCKNEWEEQWCSDDQINFSGGHEYFLCLPQHKEACLHWLNGGDAQYRPEKKPNSEFEFYWEQLEDCDDFKWVNNCVWMSQLEIRIKPKKEKRWIIFSIDSEMVVTTFDNPQIAKDSVGSDSRYQVIEIEVEV